MSTPLFVINSTVADERANSYCAITDFQDYWGQHFDVTTAATMLAITDPTLLLIRACRTIETIHFTEPVDPLADYHLVYDSRQQQIRSVKTNYGRPQKYNYYQHLQFPRTLDVYQDGTLYIPPEILGAQCEQAAYEFSFDPTILEDSLQGLDRQAISVAGVSISQHIRPKGSMICAAAYNMCKPYVINQNCRLQRA
jgi:hypothetical protein